VVTTSPTATSLHLRFAEFELDEDNALLTRAGQPIPLPPKAFSVLCTLARRGGQLTKKDALLDAVWGHRHVSESVLKTTISQVRAALIDDAAQPRYIETVARLGYRFIGAIETAPSVLTLAPQLETAPWFPAAPMIGRNAAMSRLQNAWRNAQAAQRQLVWIAGDAGIGKTTLIENFLDVLPDAVIARGQCVEQYGSGEPYLPMLEMLGSLCRRFAELPELMRDVAPTWLVQFPWLLSQTDRGVLQRELAGTHPDRMLRELTELLERFTQTRPLILVTEDLHWSDQATLRLIDHFARRPTATRLLWLCSYRLSQIQVEEHPLMALRRELRLHKLCDEILLETFSAAEIAAYISNRLPDKALPQTFIKRLHAHTGGLPLFVANVMEALLESDAENVFDSAQTPLPVPEDLAGTIENQIARLPVATCELLEAASVCGMEFHTTTLAAVLDRDQRSISDLCETLTRQQYWLREIGFLELSDGGLDVCAGFRHALYRHVFYQRLGAAQRALYHRRVARAMESEQRPGLAATPAELASHYELGQEFLPALRYYAAAAERALNHFAPLEAVDLTSHAILLLPKCGTGDAQLEIELALVARRGLACSQLFGIGSPQAAASFERAREICAILPESPSRAVLLSGLGWMLFACGKYVEAQALAQRVQKISEQFNDRVLGISACNLLGMTLAVRGENSTACAWLQRGIDGCRELEGAIPTAAFLVDPEVSMRAIISMPLSCLGLIDQARTHVKLAIERADRLGQPTARALARRCAAQLEVRLHEPERVAAIVDVLEQIVASHSLEQAAGPALYLRGWSDLHLGRLQQGWQKMQAGFDRQMRIGMLGTSTEVLGYMAEAQMLMGNYEQAQIYLQQALQLAEKIGEFFVLPILLLLQAQIEQHNSDLQASQTTLRNAAAVARQQKASLYELQTLLALAVLTQEAEDLAALAHVHASLKNGVDTQLYHQAGVLLAINQNAMAGVVGDSQ